MKGLSGKFTPDKSGGVAVAERSNAKCSNEAERRNHGWPDMTENCGSNLKSLHNLDIFNKKS